MSLPIQFEGPLLEGILVRRYKRFLADVTLASGETVTVHCPNSGSMATCCEPGSPVVIRDSENSARKLRFTWELVRIGMTWVSVHSARSNRVVEHFIGIGAIPELVGYPTIAREVTYGSEGRSRVDLELRGDGVPSCFVEVKHATMRVGVHAAFPDAVSDRARKHLLDLAREVRRGNRAVLFFVVGRGDCQRFRAAHEVDDAYRKTLRRVIKAGVEVLAYRFDWSPEGVSLRERLEVDGYPRSLRPLTNATPRARRGQGGTTATRTASRGRA